MFLVKYFVLYLCNKSDKDMTTINKITSRRELAIALSKGKVSIENVSIKLQRVIELWLSRKEIVLLDGFLNLV